MNVALRCLRPGGNHGRNCASLSKLLTSTRVVAVGGEVNGFKRSFMTIGNKNRATLGLIDVPMKVNSSTRNFGSNEGNASKKEAVGGDHQSKGSGAADWLKRMLGYYSKESVNIRSGLHLFRGCEEQSMLVCQDDSFGLDFDWNDTKGSFYARQHLLMLHVWMVHRRLLASDCGQQGKEVQECLFDTFWEETTRRIRATGVNELTVNKHLGNVQKACFTAAVSYDHGFNITDDNNLELGSAIWRTLYSSDPKIPDECVYRMSDYVRNQISAFESTSAEAFVDGGEELRWIDIEVESSKLFGEWREAVSRSGRSYWWNIKTRESRWDPPPGMNATKKEQ